MANHIHSQDCQAACEQRKAEIAAWERAWPNHCKTCCGHGGSWGTYDPSPSGVSLGAGYMVDFDPCPDCADKGLCPRCGFQAWPAMDEDYPDASSACPRCGWNQDGGCPGDPECFCWTYGGMEDPDAF